MSDGGVIFGGPLEGGKTDREADEEPADVRVVVDDLSCGWVGGWVREWRGETERVSEHRRGQVFPARVGARVGHSHRVVNV